MGQPLVHWRSVRLKSRATNDGRTKPDISGPGCVRNSLYPQQDGFCGTSASAPHVAGAAALVLSRYPSYNASQVRAYLLDYAESDGLKDYSEYAYGAGRLLLDFDPPTIIPPLEHTSRRDTEIHVTFSEPDWSVSWDTLPETPSLSPYMGLHPDHTSARFFGPPCQISFEYTTASPSATEKQYQSSISTDAMDAAGNHLTEPYSYHFVVADSPGLSSATILPSNTGDLTTPFEFRVEPLGPSRCCSYIDGSRDRRRVSFDVNH